MADESGETGSQTPVRRARRKPMREFRADRRDALIGMGLVAALALLSAGTVGVLATLFGRRRVRAETGRFQLVYSPPASGTPWYRHLIGQPVREDEIQAGDWALAVAGGSELARPVLLYRLESPPKDPDRAGGYVDTLIAFYSGCVHACCGVTGPVGADGLLYCPCHGSKFDPGDLRKANDSGLVYFGAPPRSGPATRPLPLAPIAIEADGKVQLVIDTKNREWYGYC